jgi:hypothetical protein
MTENVFKTKETEPDEEMIKGALGDAYIYFEHLRWFVDEEIGPTTREWKFYGEKLGWTLKTFLKRRNLFFISIYDGYFKIAFVFGDKAVDGILDSGIATSLKRELAEARKYAEGRGLSIRVDNAGCLDDVKELIRIKVGH